MGKHSHYRGERRTEERALRNVSRGDLTSLLDGAISRLSMGPSAAAEFRSRAIEQWERSQRDDDATVYRFELVNPLNFQLGKMTIRGFKLADAVAQVHQHFPGYRIVTCESLLGDGSWSPVALRVRGLM